MPPDNADTNLTTDPAQESQSTADVIIVGALTFLTLFVFGGAARFEFVDLDHHYYVGNPHVQDGLTLENVRWALTSVVGSNWHPVTMLAHMTVHQLFGASSAAHHLANVFLHLANALLVFAWLRGATGASWRSGAVAALFALHPLRVESVVWTAELKDLLSTFFALLAIGAYTRWSTQRVSRWYAAALILYALALMSKASVVVLPALLPLIDIWPLKRLQTTKLRPLIVEKLPFLALAVGITAITLFTFSGSTLKSNMPLDYRSVMSLQAYLDYVIQTFAPLHLAPHYPYIPVEHIARLAVAPILVLAAITGVALWQRTRRPYLFAGWLWFVIAILPVCGLLPVGSHFRADRYTYLAHIGFFVALVWLVADAAEVRPRLRLPAAALGLAAVASSAAFAYVNVQYWRNNLTLFTHGVEVSPRSSLMHSGLASAYINLGQLPAAEKELRLALHFDFDELRDWKRLAGVLLLQDRVSESIDIYAKILEQEPNVAENHLMLALALEKAGRIPEARAAAERAAALNSQNSDIAAALKRLHN